MFQPALWAEVEYFYLDVVYALEAARKPLRTPAVAIACNMTERTAYNHLRRYEREGMVCRPNGRRSGWAVKGRVQ